MSVIQKAINNLTESDKNPSSYGHDIRFFSPDKNDVVYISSGLSDDYPIYLYLEKEDLSFEQIEALKLFELKNSKSDRFMDFEKIRYSVELKLDKEYIESLILDIFEKIYKQDDLSNLHYEINPV